MSLDKTQEQFAVLMRVSNVSVARYETNHIPNPLVLNRLLDVAREYGRQEFVDYFRRYKAKQLIPFSGTDLHADEPNRYPAIRQMRRLLKQAAKSQTDRTVRLAAAITLLDESSAEGKRLLEHIERLLDYWLFILDLRAIERDKSLIDLAKRRLRLKEEADHE